MNTTSDPPMTEAPQRCELLGTFRRIVFPRELVHGSQYIIAVIDVESELGTHQRSVKGECDPNILIQGVQYRFLGRWGKPETRGNRTYDSAFLFSSIVQQQPHDRSGMVAYLKKYASGIGRGHAAKLWDAFKSEAARVLRVDPDRVLREVPSIPANNVKAASESLQLHAATEDTRIELASLFDGRGFQSKLVDEVIRLWGVNAPRVIRHDPFRMLTHRLPSCGFSRVDALYMSLGLPPGRLKRQFFAIWRKIQEDSSGHTWFPLSMARDAITEHISGCDPEDINWKRAVKLGRRAGWLAVENHRYEDGGDRWRITTADRARSESTLAVAVTRIMGGAPAFPWPRPEAIEGATEHQREVAARIFGRSIDLGNIDSPIAMLGGSPGTGKTTFTGMILRELSRIIPPHDIAVCAPTNAAAIRVRASLDKCGLSAITCGTLHSLMIPMRNGRDGQGWGFYRSRSTPLPFRLIVIDEFSMVGTDDAAQLFDAISPGSRVFCVGDHHQLLPVSHGCPLRDMMRTAIPHAELTEVMRNGGDGLNACRSIRDGMAFVPSRRIDGESGNYKHIPAGNGLQAIDRLKTLLGSLNGVMLPTGGELREIDLIRDLQVIVALNEKGDCNRKAINELMQRALNPNGSSVEGIEFRVGDKIIAKDRIDVLICCNADGEPCDPQDFEIPDDDDDHPAERIVKSEIGYVVHLNSRGAFAAFTKPGGVERIVFIPRGGKGAAIYSFELAYAVTYHKSQGSQWPIVICMIDQAANRVACRELWYVGTSRFESLLITIGDLGVMARQCRRVALNDRETYLSERIRDGLESLIPF